LSGSHLNSKAVEKKKGISSLISKKTPKEGIQPPNTVLAKLFSSEKKLIQVI
jgi:hypothetical protein